MVTNFVCELRDDVGEHSRVIGDLKVIIPLDGVKLKKSKKTGLEMLIQFQVKNKGNISVKADAFKLHIWFKGINRSIIVYYF